jgi:hypothetical protein
MLNKIHFITFYTNKEPALDLSNQEELLKSIIYNCVDSYKAFNQDMLDEIYIRQYPKLKRKEHSRGCFHGFWRWKPHIILKRLNDDDVKDNDIVIYGDCNLSRYDDRISDFRNLRNIAEKLFSMIDCDFLIAEDHNRLKMKQHIKPHTMQNIIGEDWRNYKEDMLLHANIVYCKKTPQAIEIIKEWERLCLIDDLLLPTLPEKSPLRWHTHDQAIITCLSKRLIMDGVLPKDWPGFYYDYNLKKIIFSIVKNNRVFYNG